MKEKLKWQPRKSPRKRSKLGRSSRCMISEESSRSFQLWPRLMRRKQRGSYLDFMSDCGMHLSWTSRTSWFAVACHMKFGSSPQTWWPVVQSAGSTLELIDDLNIEEQFSARSSMMWCRLICLGIKMNGTFWQLMRPPATRLLRGAKEESLATSWIHWWEAGFATLVRWEFWFLTKKDQWWAWMLVVNYNVWASHDSLEEQPPNTKANSTLQLVWWRSTSTWPRSPWQRFNQRLGDGE